MEQVFKETLKINLNKEMSNLENECPDVTLRTNCIKQIRTHGCFLTTFKVLSSNNSGKIKKLLKNEEKVKVYNSSFSTQGIVVFVDSDEIVIELFLQLKNGEYDITRMSNYNNKILLKELEKNIVKNIKTNNELILGWLSNLTERLSLQYKINLSPDIDVFEFFQSHLNNTWGYESNVDAIHIAKFIDARISYNKITKVKYFEGNLQNEFSYFNNQLNTQQKIAVSEVHNAKSYKIVGPPGTGKTSTVVEIILQLLNLNQKILVAGPSNISIDNIIERFVESKYYAIKKPSFYRLGSSIKGLYKYNLEYQVKNATKFCKKEKNYKHNLKKLQNTYETELKNEVKIVFSTLFSSLKVKSEFDWVIIDEACQGSDVECFLTIQKGRHFILVGDPNQLTPKTISLFDKITVKTILLNLQYRMCTNLIKFSNIMFYDKKIDSYKKNSIGLVDQMPLIFIDTDCSDYNEVEENNSKKNEGEANIIKKIIDYIYKIHIDKNMVSIGIITPYSAQAAYIRSLVFDNIEIKTVDGFQGREKDYIILSLVRSNNLQDIGFLDDYRRLNVAITRCKKGLVIIGDSMNFKKSSLFNKFFKFIKDNFIVIDPVEIDSYFCN